MKFQYTDEELGSVAQSILENIENPSVLCFYGPMGVGKTTLIKSIIKELGAVDPGSSPTFGLVNEYIDANAEVIAYHFDFYRIEDDSEALDMGFEDYLFSDKWVFIEWPEKISGLIPGNSVKLNMHFIDKIEHFNDKNHRFIEILQS